MNIALRFSLALGLAAAGPAAWADATTPGFYLGAAVGKAYADLNKGDVTGPLIDVGFPVTGSSEDDDDTGWKVLGGYQVNRYFGIEASWVVLGDYSINANLGGANPGQVKSELDLGGAFNLGVTAGYPFTDRLSAFAKLGAVFWDADAKSTANLASGSAAAKDDANGSDLSFGLGVAYYLTDHIAVRGDWDRYQIGGDADTDVNLWSLAVQYKF
ncbi:MAG: outer membrane beta-barrel protein [Chromatiaceae bacterium]|nr:outer membrane beta-barrel protein [Chromatiaceae bacterium]MCF7993652.1 outer membrane beta-barrel protein [Chromatiaceae bacterium]